MLVGSRMTYPVITISPRATLDSANDLINKESIHSLPVVDRQGRLLGLITKDKIDSVLCKNGSTNEVESELLVEDFMMTQVLTVTENTPIEEAARIISDYDIKSLPVIRGNYVVGIITATSLIRIFLEMTGARSQGIRLTLQVEDVPGKIFSIFKKICEMNGNVVSFSTYNSEEKGYKMMTLKIDGIEKYELKQAITPLVYKVADIR
ncbi:CBS domain-containing protein [Flexilinea flocculi]|jgi:acetoin utilization protein AcuB|uniref:Protein containing cBS domain n=1 Tax=Flexilinea flocculi TaxID=1678840 RepID=A0A0S7BWR0_9CHLR|nr:CBS domain-containing protein [Flexilinea flocculi]NMB94214.1 CBS domain-containing protein [Flexilinea flocculi]GAP41652.1 protein containing cBS domain [Flexilinea flocculi]